MRIPECRKRIYNTNAEVATQQASMFKGSHLRAISSVLAYSGLFVVYAFSSL